MTVSVILDSRVKTEKIAELLPFLEQNLPNVRGFQGCVQVRVLLNQDNGDFILYEDWESIKTHQAYIQFISANGVMESLVAFLEHPPQVKYLNKLPI